MEWLSENLFGLISLLFGAGGIGYAVVSKILDRKRYEQEVRNGKICIYGIKQVSDDKYEELCSYVLQTDDLVLARRGDLSKIAVVSENEKGWLAGTGAFFMHFIGGFFLPYFEYLYINLWKYRVLRANKTITCI